MEHMGCTVTIYDDPSGMLHAISVRYPYEVLRVGAHRVRMLYLDDRGVTQAQVLREELTDAR